MGQHPFILRQAQDERMLTLYNTPSQRDLYLFAKAKLGKNAVEEIFRRILAGQFA